MDSLLEQRRSLPKKPGVYLFQDSSGDILYIGKAKSLRSRVNAYFSGHDERYQVPALVAAIDQLEFIMTASEGEALALEQRLLKQHRPPFNVSLRESRGYPYLSYKPQDERPRIEFSWTREEAGRVYFGPYMSGKRARDAIKAINTVFRYRIGKLEWDSGLRGINRERESAERLKTAPKDYRRELERVKRFLGGDSAFIEQELRESMGRAAREHDFEQAARLRDGLSAVRELTSPQMAQRALGSVDVVGLATMGERAAIHVFIFREGELCDRHGFQLEHAEGKSEDELFEAFCLEYYDDAESVPPQVVIPPSLECSEGLEQFLTLKRGGQVELKAPLRGEKARLQELADENARLTLITPPKRVRRDLDVAGALEELAGVLALGAPPHRLECYDISNIQDLAPVAAMVVFEDGRPKRAHYRKFRMRYEGGQDDFQMMREVLERRFSRFRDGTASDPSFSSRPDLVVIDGGRGQLSAAVQALEDLGVSLPLASLAKREEEVFLPGRPLPLTLDRDSPALHLLQRLRDETHRVAVSYHRQRRSRASQQSVLDTLPGVGPKRKKQLLDHFGTPAKLERATLEELESVPGLPKRVAQQIHSRFHASVSAGAQS